jgi:hypothetical protein
MCLTKMDGLTERQRHHHGLSAFVMISSALSYIKSLGNRFDPSAYADGTDVISSALLTAHYSLLIAHYRSRGFLSLS